MISPFDAIRSAQRLTNSDLCLALTIFHSVRASANLLFKFNSSSRTARAAMTPQKLMLRMRNSVTGLYLLISGIARVRRVQLRIWKCLLG